MKIKTILLSGLVAAMLLALSGCGLFAKKQWKSDSNMATVKMNSF